MPSTPSEWDAKHKLAAETTAPEPASIMQELLPLLPLGPALDIACGTGRHTLMLAARGQRVTAVDWSGAALEILETRARLAQVPIRRISNIEEARRSFAGMAAKRPMCGGIDLLQADLERTVLPERSYDVVLCIRYLQRSLFPQMASALRPGGILLFETYTRAQLAFEKGPRNPAYLLKTNELREAFPELSVLFYRELCAGQGIATLLARKPRQKGLRSNWHSLNPAE